MRRLQHIGWRATTLGAVLGLAACAFPEAEATTPGGANNQSLGADFGNAVAHNTAQQVVDPAPAHVRLGAPALDGARALGALERYRSGTVIAPQEIETTNFGAINR